MYSRPPSLDGEWVDGNRTSLSITNRSHRADLLKIKALIRCCVKFKLQVFIPNKKINLKEHFLWKCNLNHLYYSKNSNIEIETKGCIYCKKIDRIGKSAQKRIVGMPQKCESVGIIYLDCIKFNSFFDKCIFKLQHKKCSTIYTILGASFRSSQKSEAKGCPNCSLRRRVKKEEAQEYAKNKGGKLIKWNNIGKKDSTWFCGKHYFSSSWCLMKKNNAWCKFCCKRFITPKYNNSLQYAKKSLYGYRNTDLKKNLENDLDLEFVLQAKNSICHYCKRKATGLDRKDSTIGHTRANCVPCCVRCNWVKGHWLSYAVMLEIGKLLEKIDP